MAGALAAWASAALPTASGAGAAGALAGELAWAPGGAHGTLAVTGVRWAPEPDAAACAGAPAARLLSTGADGRARAWRLAEGRLAPAPEPVALLGGGAAPAGQGAAAAGKPCMGAALAVGGVAAAVVQLSAAVGAEHVGAVQAHTRLVRARLRLLAGPALAGARDAAAAAAAARAAAARLAAGPPSAQALWGAALTLRRAGAAVAAEAGATDAGDAGDASSGGGGSADAALTQARQAAGPTRPPTHAPLHRNVTRGRVTRRQVAGFWLSLVSVQS